MAHASAHVQRDLRALWRQRRQTPQRRSVRRLCTRARRRDRSRILDLFGEDSRLNVYAGELEVRPPVAWYALDGSRTWRPVSRGDNSEALTEQKLPN
jgi:hypothetical protein